MRILFIASAVLLTLSGVAHATDYVVKFENGGTLPPPQKGSLKQTVLRAFTVEANTYCAELRDPLASNEPVVAISCARATSTKTYSKANEKVTSYTSTSSCDYGETECEYGLGTWTSTFPLPLNPKILVVAIQRCHGMDEWSWCRVDLSLVARP